MLFVIYQVITTGSLGTGMTGEIGIFQLLPQKSNKEA